MIIDESIKKYEPKDPSKFFRSLLDEFKKKDFYSYNIWYDIPKVKDFENREEYDKYYRFTRIPMSFTIIRDEITNGNIISINDFLVKLDLMFNNCRNYNVINDVDDNWQKKFEILSILNICKNYQKNINNIIISKVENAIKIEENRETKKKEKRLMMKIK